MTRPEQADEKGPGSKRRSRALMQLYARRIKQMLSFIDTDGAVKEANMYWSVNGDQGGSDVGLFLPIWLCVACILLRTIIIGMLTHKPTKYTQHESEQSIETSYVYAYVRRPFRWLHDC